MNPIHDSARTITSFAMTEAEYQVTHDDNTGACTSCGHEAYGVEPDARKYTCRFCGAPAVYGLEELLLMGKVTFVEDVGQGED